MKLLKAGRGVHSDKFLRLNKLKKTGARSAPAFSKTRTKWLVYSLSLPLTVSLSLRSPSLIFGLFIAPTVSM